MEENDLCNLDTRKSNLNKLTQFIPEPLRARVYELVSSSRFLTVKRIVKITEHYYAVYYTNPAGNEDYIIYEVKADDYWASLSQIQVEVEELPLPIQPH